PPRLGHLASWSVSTTSTSSSRACSAPSPSAVRITSSPPRTSRVTTSRMLAASTGSPPALAMVTFTGCLAAALTNRAAGLACSPIFDATAARRSAISPSLLHRHVVVDAGGDQLAARTTLVAGHAGLGLADVAAPGNHVVLQGGAGAVVRGGAVLQREAADREQAAVQAGEAVAALVDVLAAGGLAGVPVRLEQLQHVLEDAGGQGVLVAPDHRGQDQVRPLGQQRWPDPVAAFQRPHAVVDADLGEPVAVALGHQGDRQLDLAVFVAFEDEYALGHAAARVAGEAPVQHPRLALLQPVAGLHRELLDRFGSPAPAGARGGDHRVLGEDAEERLRPALHQQRQVGADGLAHDRAHLTRADESTGSWRTSARASLSTIITHPDGGGGGSRSSIRLRPTGQAGGFVLGRAKAHHGPGGCPGRGCVWV